MENSIFSTNILIETKHNYKYTVDYVIYYHYILGNIYNFFFNFITERDKIASKQTSSMNSGIECHWPVVVIIVWIVV